MRLTSEDRAFYKRLAESESNIGCRAIGELLQRLEASEAQVERLTPVVEAAVQLRPHLDIVTGECDCAECAFAGAVDAYLAAMGDDQ